ncbi:uncharacterized protein LOC143174739 [Nomia melanderi]|uniref:uncharacterized protein LOC143174739 n=1 Tax=Nomia melanderi TaxID=2448451 RepID=UPI003FCEC566
MPPYTWGMQSIPSSSKSDNVAVNTRRNINRQLKILSNNISTIDASRMKEVDDLFKGVQIHRSQYKDHTGTLHPLSFFKSDEYKYQCAAGMTTSYFSKYPQNYVEYKTPPVLPLTYQRRRQTPYIPHSSLTGVYNQSSCFAYKR